MFRRLSLIVLCLHLATPLRAEDRRTDKSHLVIMAFNAEFLWDGVTPEEGEASVTFPWKGSQTEAEDHMAAVADIIKGSNPDIVSLEEVENLNALTTFNIKFLAGRGYRPYLINGKDTTTGQDVALLTRIDPENEIIERDDREGQSGHVSKGVSKNYFAKLNLDGRKIALIGFHLLAHPTQSNLRFEREAQAEVIHRLALELLQQAWLPVVLGDFNDFDGSDGSRDHIDSMPITNVLQIAKEMDTSNDADDLINAASFLPQADRYTAFYDQNDNGTVDPPNELTSIDHILLHPELANAVEQVDIPHNHDPVQHPDHFPVVVHLRFSGTPSGPTVQITSLLPNPAGDENQNEQATLKNLGSQPVSLASWKLRDLKGKTWSLDELGTLQPGQQKVITRKGQPMAMNNGGDTIDLIDPTGKLIQSVTYTRTEEGEFIFPSN